MNKVKTENSTLVWLRRDLRLDDHVPLWEATNKSHKVYLVFIYDRQILDRLPSQDDARLDFITASLHAMRRSLETKKESFQIFHGNPQELIPKIAKDLGVQSVLAGEDYEPMTIARDKQVGKELNDLGISFELIKDQVIFHKDEILNQSGLPYKVFTPYKRAWLKRLNNQKQKNHAPKLQNLTSWPMKLRPKRLPTHKDLGFNAKPTQEQAGEHGAKIRLTRFIPILDQYGDNRDFPERDAGSYLSIHLRFGTISIRKLVNKAMSRTSEGSEIWLSELIWREFYKTVMYWFPHVTRRCFRPEYDQLAWTGKTKWFNAWKKGETGFPLIDAAMREFSATGKMHNRLRMVVAHFLVKDLQIDWRKGEKYFADKLLDFDLSANNGGWQWSASVGCDAQPYFRIFNPWSQSKRFDPNGNFIRQHLPELADIPGKCLSDPAKLAAVRPKNYPAPIVDHKEMRQLSLAMFKNIKKG